MLISLFTRSRSLSIGRVEDRHSYESTLKTRLNMRSLISVGSNSRRDRACFVTVRVSSSWDCCSFTRCERRSFVTFDGGGMARSMMSDCGRRISHCHNAIDETLKWSQLNSCMKTRSILDRAVGAAAPGNVSGHAQPSVSRQP